MLHQLLPLHTVDIGWPTSGLMSWPLWINFWWRPWSTFLSRSSCSWWMCYQDLSSLNALIYWYLLCETRYHLTFLLQQSCLKCVLLFWLFQLCKMSKCDINIISGCFFLTNVTYICLWFRLKYLKNYWIDCHEILDKHSWCSEDKSYWYWLSPDPFSCAMGFIFVVLSKICAMKYGTDIQVPIRMNFVDTFPLFTAISVSVLACRR